MQERVFEKMKTFFTTDPVFRALRKTEKLAGWTLGLGTLAVFVVWITGAHHGALSPAIPWNLSGESLETARTTVHTVASMRLFGLWVLCAFVGMGVVGFMGNRAYRRFQQTVSTAHTQFSVVFGDIPSEELDAIKKEIAGFLTDLQGEEWNEVAALVRRSLDEKNIPRQWWKLVHKELSTAVVQQKENPHRPAVYAEFDHALEQVYRRGQNHLPTVKI